MSNKTKLNRLIKRLDSIQDINPYSFSQYFFVDDNESLTLRERKAIQWSIENGIRYEIVSFNDDLEPNLSIPENEIVSKITAGERKKHKAGCLKELQELYYGEAVS